ncbi:MAG: sigma-54-dependent Fis family transcriptional regulator [Ignavibacteriales bacterium]|nr:sigma-54-dependent Fis family transcriptional regulator [Ignavibacteriales bacterium]
MKHLLVATSSLETAEQIKDSLLPDFQVDYILEKLSILNAFSNKHYDFLLIDIEYLISDESSNDFKNFVKPFWQISPDAEIIVLTKNNRIRDAVNAVKSGMSDYLTLPIQISELKLIIKRIEDKNKILSELNYLRSKVIETDLPTQLNTKSSLMKEVYSNVRSVAETESTVLLTGETGTGKGLLAKLIHQESKRRDSQFINIHCGAIPDTLLESELFGHEKGAFTGAIRRKLGKFEIADKGTIFLDEIGTISVPMQIKLLQVLQEKMFYRVGGEESIKTNVRIIAATNADLAELSREDKFRLDLYYRLNVFQIELPPLRKRLEDLPFIIEQILNKLNKFLGKEIVNIHDEVMQAFFEYEWPGNIRELENLLERAYILENTTILTPKSFPIKLFKEKYQKIVKPIDISLTLSKIRQIEIERVEKEYLTQLLMKNKGKIKETALQAGIGERQLNKLMNEYNLQKEDYKR